MTKTDELRLETIYNAFNHALKELIKKNAVSEKKYYGQGDKPCYFICEAKECVVYKFKQTTFFDFWIMDDIAKTFDIHIQKDPDTKKISIFKGNGQYKLDKYSPYVADESLVHFSEYKNYLGTMLEKYIAIFTLSKKETFEVKGYKKHTLTVTVDVVQNAIKYHSIDDIDKLVNNFIGDMVEYILNSKDYTEIDLHQWLNKSLISPLEKLTLLSLLSLFAGRCDEYQYTIEQFIGHIFDEQGNLKALPPRQSEVDFNQQEKITSHTVYAAGQHWYWAIKARGNRFSKLIPNQELLSLAGNLPVNVHKDNEEDQPLLDMIKKTKGNIYLIGEGGIGKTTALYKIMEEAYKDNNPNQIPLFIELSKARNPADFELITGAPSSHFIRNTVLRQIQKCYANPTIEQIETLFMETSNEPKFVLLLDGLNEVSRDVLGDVGVSIISMIISEIEYIMRTYSNVRVILTSRSEERFGDNITSLYLSGIKPETVVKYLEESGLKKERITKVEQNQELMDILRIPLLLTLYANLNGDEDYLSRGEILHAFFKQKKDEEYSERNRIEDINREITEETGIDLSSGVTPNMLNFMLDFIVPKIAWKMVQEDAFQIDEDQIRDIVRVVLEDKTDTSNCGTNGQKCFEEYRSNGSNTRVIARSIVSVFGKNVEDEDDMWSDISTKVCIYLHKTLGILQIADSYHYEFVHQHVRDYFAALYHINRMRLACYLFKQGEADTSRACLSEWKENPLPSQILTFIGEALGELHNVPVFDESKKKWIYTVPDITNECESNLIKRTFDIYRDRFDGTDGYSVWNLFQILKQTRQDLSGADFSRLDLEKCCVNGYPLVQSDVVSKFDGSKICDTFFIPQGHEGRVIFVKYSPNGKKIVTASVNQNQMIYSPYEMVFYSIGITGRFPANGSQMTIKIWDAKTYQVTHTFVYETENLSFNGEYFIVSEDNVAEIWDANKCIKVGELRGDRSIRFAQFSSQGDKILVVSKDNVAEIWDANKCIKVGELRGDRLIQSAQFSPQGDKILVVYDDGVAEIWDTVEYSISYRLSGSASYCVQSAQFSDDGKYIVAVTDDDWVVSIIIWSVENNEVITRWSRGRSIRSAQFSPKGNKILVFYDDGVVEIWDTVTYGYRQRLSDCDNYRVISAQYSPDEKHIVTVADKGSCNKVTIWDAETYQEIRTLNGHTASVSSAQYSPDGKYILGISNNSVIVWNSATYMVVSILEGKNRQFMSVQFRPDGKCIMLGSEDGTVKIWDTEKHQVNQVLVVHTEAVIAARYSPDGENIVAVSKDGIAKVWDASSNHVIRILKGWTTSVVFAQYSPDGKNILIKLENGTVEVWDAETYQLIRTLSGNGGIRSAQFSPQGDKILVVYADGIAEILDTVKYSISYRLSESYYVQSAQFSNDGKYIVAVAYDDRFELIILWSVENNKVITHLKGQRSVMCYDSPQYSPDGKHILVYSLYTQAFEVWDVDNRQMIQTLNRISAEEISYSPDGQYIAIIEGDEAKLLNTSGKCIQTIKDIPGLVIQGIDLSNLHEESNLSDEVKEHLNEYGAIVNDE